MKKLYVGTNTKMYKTPSAAVEHVLKLRELTRDIAQQLELFVIPSYTSIAPCVQAVGEDILIGAQNMGWEDEGQYTGEISAPMLEEVGARLVMIGHSERRHVLHETDEEEQKKIADMLTAFDSYIKRAVCELDLFLAMKKALLQQLFI